MQNTRQNTYVLIISLMLLCIEIYFLQGREMVDDCSLYISQLFFIPSLFIFSLNCMFPFELFGHTSITYRNLSTSIYLLHSPIICIIKAIMFFVFGLKYLHPVFLFPLTLAILIIVLYPIYKTKHGFVYNLIR